jgi:hypothetical protein
MDLIDALAVAVVAMLVLPIHAAMKLIDVAE